MKVISITGGKGGVGKSTISVNMAVAMAKSGKRVLLFDADLGLANVDVLLGLKPAKTIHDYINGYCDFNEICIEGPYGLKIIPSASGVQQLADLSLQQSSSIIHAFSTLAVGLDVMLIDLASGISRQVIDFTHAAQNILLVVCNDPSSLVDSYAVIKILNKHHNRQKFGIVINKAKNQKEASLVFLKFQETVSQFLDVSVEYLGYVPQDDLVNVAAIENVAVVDKYPISSVSLAMNSLCDNLHNWCEPDSVVGGVQYFFEKLVMPEPSIIAFAKG